MEYKALSKNEAMKQMEKWIDSEKLPEISGDYVEMRKYLVEQYIKVKNEYRDLYNIDLHFGIALYKYLCSMKDFTMRVATNDDFWRYVSLMVIPDIVSDRWGKENKSHFFERTTRIWVRVLWWYIYMSWQGNIEVTQLMLEKKAFTTDEILNLVERVGRHGICIDVYRKIVKKYSHIPDAERIRHKEGEKTLFRKLLIKNNAKYLVIDPMLYGIDEYVQSIFDDLKVSFA